MLVTLFIYYSVRPFIFRLFFFSDSRIAASLPLRLRSCSGFSFTYQYASCHAEHWFPIDACYAKPPFSHLMCLLCIIRSTTLNKMT